MNLMEAAFVLANILESRLKMLEDHISPQPNKESTGDAFVLPFLQAIGWNIYDYSQFRLNYKCNYIKNGSRIAYSLWFDFAPVFLIETIPLYDPWPTKKPIVVRTAKASPAQFLGITNGIEWDIYDVNKDNAGIVLKFGLYDNDALEKLSLLSYENITGGRFNRYVLKNPLVNQKPEWSVHHISKTTHVNINELKMKINCYRVDARHNERINNNDIIDTVLQAFIENSDNFDCHEIPNVEILKARVMEMFIKAPQSLRVKNSYERRKQ